ncbi:MAG: hypothetical protein ACOX0T_06680 [Pelotomaculum sp.]
MAVYPCFLALMAGVYLISQAHTGVVLLAAAALIGYGYGNFITVSQVVALSRARY